LKSLYAKFQLSSFKTEGGVWGDGHPDRKCNQQLCKSPAIDMMKSMVTARDWPW